MRASAQSRRPSHPESSSSRGTGVAQDGRAILRTESSPELRRAKFSDENREDCRSKTESRDRRKESPRLRLGWHLHRVAELLQKFFAQAVEAAVGHHQQQVASSASAARDVPQSRRAWNTRASLPKRADALRHPSGSSRFSSPSCCARNTPPRITRSAKASACGSVS